MIKLPSLILILVMITSGCSTAFKERKQRIMFETTIDNKPLSLARCHVKDNNIDIWITTPEAIEVNRESHHLVIFCQKDGYQMSTPEEITSSNNLGMSVAGGAGVGASAGAIYGLPVLILPVVGEIIYASVIASTAAVGAGVSAATDTASGRSYALPSRIKVPMKKSIVSH